MLTTDYIQFNLKGGVMFLSFLQPSIPHKELVRALKMAVMHARRKKIKKPVQWVEV